MNAIATAELRPVRCPKCLIENQFELDDPFESCGHCGAVLHLATWRTIGGESGIVVTKIENPEKESCR